MASDHDDRPNQRTQSLKNAGQDASAHDLGEQRWRRFRRLIEDIKPGTEFTTNDIRDELEAADILPKFRGFLMREAVREGLVEFVTHRYRGKDHPIQIPSDLKESHGDKVSLYRRCLTHVDRTPPKPAPAQGALFGEVAA